MLNTDHFISSSQIRRIRNKIKFKLIVLFESKVNIINYIPVSYFFFHFSYLRSIGFLLVITDTFYRDLDYFLFLKYGTSRTLLILYISTNPLILLLFSGSIISSYLSSGSIYTLLFLYICLLKSIFGSFFRGRTGFKTMRSPSAGYQSQF